MTSKQGQIKKNCLVGVTRWRVDLRLLGGLVSAKSTSTSEILQTICTNTVIGGSSVVLGRLVISGRGDRRGASPTAGLTH